MRSPNGRAVVAALACAALLAAAGCDQGFHVLFGFIDDEGQWAVEPAFEDLAPMSGSLAAARKDGRWGFIDAGGGWVIEPRYTVVKSFSEGLAAVATGASWQFIDRRGRVIIAGPFDAAEPFEAGMAAVRTGGGWGFVDHAGELIVGPQFEELAGASGSGADPTREPCFSEGLCAARVAAGWGYIDRSGRWIVPPGYLEAGPYREGLAAVREAVPEGEGRVGYIDRKGRWVVEPRFASGLWFSGGRAIAVVESTGEVRTGAATEEPEPPTAGEAQKHAVMIDRSGSQIATVGWQSLSEGQMSEVGAVLSRIAPDYLAEGLVPATLGDAWGFMDRDGKWAIEPRFGLVMPFVNGLAAAAIRGEDPSSPIVEGGWGLIDATGRWIVEPTFRNIGRYGEPYVMAQLHARWGLLDRDGGWRVPPRFADQPEWLDFNIPGLEPGLTEGLQRAAVFADHRWSALDRRGRSRDLGTLEWLDALAPDGNDTGLVAFLERGRWGIVDRRIRRLLAPQLDERPRPSGEAVAAVRDGLAGCVDARGRWIVPPQFREIEACGPGAIIAATATGWGVWKSGSGWLLPPTHASVERMWRDVYATEGQDGWRLLRLDDRAGTAAAMPGGPYDTLEVLINGTVVVGRDGRFAVMHEASPAPGPFLIDEVSQRYVAAPEGPGSWITAVRVGERWGVVDASGRERVPAGYDEIGRGYDDLLAVRTGERWGIVDLDGSEIFPAAFESAVPFSRKATLFRKDGRWGLVSRRGSTLLEPRFGAIAVQDGWLVVTAPAEPEAGGPEVPRKGLADRQGRVVVAPRYRTIEGFGERYWLVQDDAGWSLLAKPSGRHERDLPGVDKVVSRSEARVLVLFHATEGSDPAFGYLDDRGRIVIPPGFSEAKPFRAGMAVVGRDGKCGVIDPAGRKLAPIRFDHCNRLPDGRVALGTESPFDGVKWASPPVAATAGP